MSTHVAQCMATASALIAQAPAKPLVPRAQGLVRDIFAVPIQQKPQIRAWPVVCPQSKR